MEQVKANSVAAVLRSVAAYGGQLAAVFHNYALIAESVPRGFEGAINILDATVATLNQVLSLVSDDAENKDGMKRFNDVGLAYVHLLAKECASSLAKVEPIVVEACLERKERNAKRKQSRKASSKKPVIQVDPLLLKVDEKEFLETVEKAKWSFAADDMEECMERLYDLQLHILLVFQVVKVGVLSKDLTSGKVDIQSIVTYHDRINRTADLIGIKAPSGRITNHRTRVSRRVSISDSSSDSSSDTGSDNSIIIFNGKKKLPSKAGPPPAPPARTLGVPPPPPAPTPPALNLGPSIKAPPIISPKAPYPSLTATIPKPGLLVDNGNPPAYFESKPLIITTPSSVSGSTLLGTVSQNVSVTSPQLDSSEKKATVYPNEKAFAPEKGKPHSVEITKSSTPEGHLFKSCSNGLGFRIKSFFRSKYSLAAEMKRVLSDSDSHLLAFVIQEYDSQKVPHSAFHELEATHMRTILSQLNDNTWYKTFSNLDASENDSVCRILRPCMNGRLFERELIVLKVLEQNRLNAWMALLGEVLRNRPFAPMANGRILLAIVREKYVDGKPLKEIYPRLGPPPPPPPPPPFPPMLVRPAVLVPPMPYTPPRRTTISDLRGPPGPPSIQVWPSNTLNHIPCPPPMPGRMGLAPSLNSPPGVTSNSIRISDTTPLTDADATSALTTYNEYTMRLGESIDPSVPRCWLRVAITQESSEKHLIVQRAQRFQHTGGNVIEAKLRMTEQQSAQVTRLMDDLKCTERDSRFEWCWVELSLYDPTGEIMDFIPNGTSHIANSATLMHLVAKRCLKATYKPLDVYNALMKPVPRPPVPTPPGIIRLGPAKPIKKKATKYVTSSSDSDSSYYSSDSSIGQVRRQLRHYRAKKARRDDKRRRFISDSDTDSGSDSEVEDVIKVKVNLKRGDDIVKVLLDLWTTEVEVEGKGKGKMVS